MTAPIRPTKKQREILTFIEEFIGKHGYSPSYREIMSGLGYTSVATVALHVNSLIKRGHIRKRDRSARSLEIVRETPDATDAAGQPVNVAPSEEKWLVDRIEQRFKALEAAETLEQKELDELYVLVGALKILELEAAALSFIQRLNEMRNPQT